jgi:hypothetical protein
MSKSNVRTRSTYAFIFVCHAGIAFFFARIAVMRAMNRHDVPELNPKGREVALGPAQTEEG